MALVPAENVSVPVTVWLADRLMFFRPAAVMPVNDRLLKLFVPLSVTVPALVLVKLTLLKVWLFPDKVGEVAEQFICDVLAVTVKFARLVSVVPRFIGVDADNVVVPVPKLTVLEFPLSDCMVLAVKL